MVLYGILVFFCLFIAMGEGNSTMCCAAGLFAIELEIAARRRGED